MSATSTEAYHTNLPESLVEDDNRSVTPTYTLLKENWESPSAQFDPSDAEIHDYAAYIGLDPLVDKHLLHLARQGLTARLPDEWKAYQNQDGDVFYWNEETSTSSWDHPMDEYHRKLVREAKERDKAHSEITMVTCVENHHDLAKLQTSRSVVAYSGKSDRGAMLRARFYEAANDPQVQVTAASAVAGSVVLGTTGAVVGTTAGAVTGAAVGVVPALFTFGLSIPIGAAIGGGVGFCAGTATGAGTGLVAGGAAGYKAYGYYTQPVDEQKQLTDA